MTPPERHLPSQRLAMALLRYSWARYYHTDLQRFISEDPLEFDTGDVNLYAYAGNSPINFIDPLGLVTEPVPLMTVRDPFDPVGATRAGVPHRGVDLRRPKGTCVVATDDGKVIKINPESAGGAGGNEIVVRNFTGAIVVYSHTAPAIGIVQGAQVQEGRPIGVTDYGSGTAKGRPHLHYMYLPQYAKAPAYVDPIAHHLAEANPYPAGTSCQPKSKSAK